MIRLYMFFNGYTEDLSIPIRITLPIYFNVFKCIERKKSLNWKTLREKNPRMKTSYNVNANLSSFKCKNEKLL